MKPYAFPKPEHLCRKRDIEALFSAGSHAFTVYPVRAVFRRVPRSTPTGPAVQVLISVAKRRLHHAVDRNRAKRQLREAYRLNKAILSAVVPEGESLHVGFIWLAERPVDSRTVAARIPLLLHRIAERLTDPERNASAAPAAETSSPTP